MGHYVLRPFCDLCILCLGPFYAVGRFEPLAVLCRGPFWALVMGRFELGPFLGRIFACASYSGLHSLGKGGCIRLMRACSVMLLTSDSSILGSISM